MSFSILDSFQKEKADEHDSICPVDAIFDEYDLTPDQEIYLEKAENFYGR